ncbi:MAG: hypothetical protein ACTSWI_00015 [Alphaproteobacteria bacterium]
MNKLLKFAAPTIALSFIAAAGTAHAEVDQGVFTTNVVSPTQPFGALPLDQTVDDLWAVDRMITALSDIQLEELNQRCAVIIKFRVPYAFETIAFCDRSYFAQGIDAYDIAANPE